MKKNNQQVLVSGSIVYDRIMDFPGFFKDHILPDQTHILNVSFTLRKTTESFGGTAGNIAYNLSLLKEPAVLFGVVGHDFARYQKWLSKNKIDASYIKQVKDEPTSSAYIMTDKSDNQIAGFYPGPTDTKYCSLISKIKNPSIAIVSPDFKPRMIEYVRLYKELGIDYIFDPGQQLTSFTTAELKNLIKGAKVLIGNDYEIKLILNKLSVEHKDITKMVDILVVTKGSKGSQIYSKDGKINIAPAKVKNVIDPTGAGDAYRAGFIKGLVSGADLKKSGQLASTISAFAIEHQGTQMHKFTLKEFTNRYKQNYEASY